MYQYSVQELYCKECVVLVPSGSVSQIEFSRGSRTCWDHSHSSHPSVLRLALRCSMFDVRCSLMRCDNNPMDLVDLFLRFLRLTMNRFFGDNAIRRGSHHNINRIVIKAHIKKKGRRQPWMNNEIISHIFASSIFFCWRTCFVNGCCQCRPQGSLWGSDRSLQ